MGNSNVNGCLGLRLVNICEPNAEEYILKPVTGNIALACVLDLNETLGVYFTKKIAKQLGVLPEKLLVDALKSAPEIDPVKIESIAKRLGLSDDSNGPVAVSSEFSNNGAAIFYPGVLDQLFLRFNGSFFVIPRNKQEFLCYPDLANTQEERDSIFQTLSKFHQEEIRLSEEAGFISESIFYYNGYGLSEYRMQTVLKPKGVFAA